MLTQRRIARFGLAAALSLLIGSMAILLAQSEPPSAAPGESTPAEQRQAAPAPAQSHAQDGASHTFTLAVK